MVGVLRAVEGSELAAEAQGAVRLAALLNLGELLVEPEREVSLDVVQDFLDGGILALVGHAGEEREVALGRGIALENLRDRVHLLHHLLAPVRQPSEPTVPLHHLVNHVAPVHPALQHRAVGVTRRRPGVVAAAPHQRFDHVPHVLGDVRNLQAVLVHRLERVRDGGYDGVNLRLRELALLRDDLLACPVLLEGHVVGPPGEEQFAAEGWEVADGVHAHESLHDPLGLHLDILGLTPSPRLELHALGPVGGTNVVVRRGEHLLLDDGRLEPRLPAAEEAAAALLLLLLLSLLRLLGLGRGVERLVTLLREVLGIVLGILVVILVVIVLVLLGGDAVPHGEEFVQFAEIAEDVHRVLQLLGPDAGDVGLDLLALGLTLLALDEVGELILRVLVGLDELFLGRRLFVDVFVVAEIFELLGGFSLVGLVLVVGLAEEILLEVAGGLGLGLFRVGRLLEPLLLDPALEPGDLVVLEEIVIILVELELLAPLSLLGRLVVLVGVVGVVLLDDGVAIAPAPHHDALVVGIGVAEAEVRWGDPGGGLLGGRLGDRRAGRLGRGRGLGLGGLGRRRGAIGGGRLSLSGRASLSLSLDGLLALVARHGLHLRSRRA